MTITAIVIIRMATFPVDTYIAQTLLRDLVNHDRQPSAFLLYFFLWWRTLGQKKTEIAISLQDLAIETGLAKRTIQDARRLLVRRKLLAVTRPAKTAAPRYRVLRPWA